MTSVHFPSLQPLQGAPKKILSRLFRQVAALAPLHPVLTPPPILNILCAHLQLDNESSHSLVVNLVKLMVAAEPFGYQVEKVLPAELDQQFKSFVESLFQTQAEAFKEITAANQTACKLHHVDWETNYVLSSSSGKGKQTKSKLELYYEQQGLFGKQSLQLTKEEVVGLSDQLRRMSEQMGKLIGQR